MTNKLITRAIEDLAKRYLSEGKAGSVYAINCGLCQDFSWELVSALDKIGGIRASEVFVDDFLHGDAMDDHRVALDRDRIGQNWPGFSMPEGIDWDDMDRISEQFGFAGTTHVWVEADGMHYDAEEPNGVENPLELPYFQRVFEAYRKPVLSL